MATSPPNISAHSPSTRSRVSSTASNNIPELHRVPNGRIARARSASTFQLSEHNRRACWAAATGRQLHLEPDEHLTGLVSPTSLSLASTNTCVLSTSTLESLEAISSSESHVSASVSSASSILEGSVDPQNLKSVASLSKFLQPWLTFLQKLDGVHDACSIQSLRFLPVKLPLK